MTKGERIKLLREKANMRRHPDRWSGASEMPYPCARCRRRR